MVKNVLVLALVAAGLLCAQLPVARAQDDDAGAPSTSPSQQKLGDVYVCTATNALRDKKCSVSCPSRETADCEDADGSDNPVCQCTKS